MLLILLALLSVVPVQEKEAPDLTKNWEGGPAAFNPKDKDFAPTVKVEKDKITIRNRGIVVSKAEMPETGAVSLSATWMWTEGEENGSYDDHPCFVLRTSGMQKGRPFEAADGFVIRILPNLKKIQIEDTTKAEPLKEYIAGEVFRRKQAYVIKIVDLGEKLEVYVDGGDKPIMECDVPKRTAGTKIAMYNREPVSNWIHELVLTDVIVTSKK